jgi:hypothetical protein
VIEIAAASTEQALLDLCAAREPVARILIGARPSAFLACNTVDGLSFIDFQAPANRKVRELAAALGLHCDRRETDRFYGGLTRDMIAAIARDVPVVYQARAEPTRVPALADVRDRTPADPGGGAAGARGATRLVAFGDSCTAGTDIDVAELGKEDPSYRESRAYPRVLARMLQIEYGGNHALAGTGNNSILRRICDYVTQHRDDLARTFFVVGLSHPQRKSFVLKGNGREYRYIDDRYTEPPALIQRLCSELFDARGWAADTNRELELRFRTACAFLDRLGVRYLVFPAWDVGESARHFRGLDAGRGGAFFFDQRQEAFGLYSVGYAYKLSPWRHPLTEGHEAMAAALAQLVRERELL